MTGGVMLGPEAGWRVQGAVTSARPPRLPKELIPGEEVQRRFPPFRLQPSTVAVQEPNAGVLFPEACVRAHLDGAAAAGAALHFEESGGQWGGSWDRVEVTTSGGTYTAPRLVITAGPWAPPVLRDLGLPLQVERNVMYWFTPLRNGETFAPERFPIYICEYRKDAFFYGFPALPDGSVKAAHHHSGELCTPETIRRDVGADEVARMRALLAALLPGAGGG